MVSITRALKLNKTHTIYPLITIFFHTKKWKTVFNPPFWYRVQSHNFTMFIRQCKALWDLFATKNSILYWKSLKVLKVFEHSKYEFIHHSDHYKNRFPAPGLQKSYLRVYKGGEHTMTPAENLFAGYRPVMVLHYELISYVLRSGSHFKCYSIFRVVWFKINK